MSYTIPNEMINKILIYSYSFIWDDIHTNLRIHFGIIDRKKSLEWILFKKLIKYHYINGWIHHKRNKTR